MNVRVLLVLAALLVTGVAAGTRNKKGQGNKKHKEPTQKAIFGRAASSAPAARGGSFTNEVGNKKANTKNQIWLATKL